MEKNKSREFLLCITIALLALNLIASLWPATPVGAEEKPPEKQMAAVLVSSSEHYSRAGGQSIDEVTIHLPGESLPSTNGETNKRMTGAFPQAYSLIRSVHSWTA